VFYRFQRPFYEGFIRSLGSRFDVQRSNVQTRKIESQNTLGPKASFEDAKVRTFRCPVAVHGIAYTSKYLIIYTVVNTFPYNNVIFYAPLVLKLTFEKF